MIATSVPVPRVRIRPIQGDDRAALRQFYAGLSPDSRYARFHGATAGLGASSARFLCGPDHEHREGLVAEIGSAAGDRQIVAHLCLEPVGPGQMEMAIAVADRFQRHGIGKRLLAIGIAWARRRGITELQASMLWGNEGVRRLILGTGYPLRLSTPSAGVVDASLRIGRVLRTAA
ncbi:MAG: N-acetyltransferase family protein [Candidatus Limnocylindrales bacterium]